MARRKSLDKMSAEELYQLAREREADEQAESDQSKEQIAALKKQRKELISEHKNALRAIDREITRLQGGKTARKKSRASTGGDSRGELPAKALDLINSKGPISTKDLKKALDTKGIDTTYLAQCLAGLKKKGQVTSPSRGVYQAA